MAAILDSAILNVPSWIQPFCRKCWLKLIQYDSNSFFVTQLYDGSHLEFGHLGFSHLSISSQTHSHLPRLIPTICTNKLHSFILTELDNGSHLEFWHVGFRTLPSWIQTPCYLLSDSLKNTLTPTLTLTQTNSIWLKLIHSHLIWWWQPSWIWPSWIQPS